jgi:hypothetical protein
MRNYYQDFEERYGDGSPGPERIRRSESGREGEPFDDSHLDDYKQTIFNYELPDGTLLYQQVRYDDDRNRAGVDPRKKKFLPRRPAPTKPRFVGHENANSNFVFGPGERRIIFNWPAIVKTSPSIPIFVCQGEKNAKDLIDRGLIATTVISADWTPECVGALAGRELFILEDNDESGRRAAARARNLLSIVAKSTRIITIPFLWRYISKNEPAESTDVSDWLDCGGDPKELMKICREVPVEDAIAAEPHSFQTEEDISMWDFLYNRHLLRGSVSLTAGIGGMGKSSKAIAEAIALTVNKSLLGVQPYIAPLRVLLVNLEDDRNTVDKRVAAVMKHYKLSPGDVGDRLTTVARSEFKLKIATLKRLGVIEPNEAAIRNLIEFIREKKFDVVSIDPLRKTHRVPENDNGAMGEVIELYEEIALAANCAIHLWHHVRKGNGGETTVESIRGASAIVDVPRSCEVLERMSAKEAKGFGISVERRGYYFRSFNGKLNFAPPVYQSDWFELASVHLENGIPGDDVGVVTRWLPPDVRTVPFSPEVIEEIKAAVGIVPRWRENSRADLWVGKAVAPIVDLSVYDERDAVHEIVGRLLAAGILRVVDGKDAARRIVSFVVAA